MNPQNAIEVHNLVKEYRLYERGFHRLIEALFPFLPKRSRPFVANDRITLAIPRGQSLGILGKNGSGKSTLLKIISGIVTPTSGTVEVNGRIAALLELGAGFNPEMTGLENIKTFCGIMGLSAQEIADITPEIIDFAEIGDHVSQPVKTYSSGMFVRLAFAVSITVKPDILIVDEALAVGDARFQRKCFRKMQEFKSAGKTIIFVSHGLDQIKEFCDHAVLLHQGKIVAQGKPIDVVMKYYDLMFPRQARNESVGGNGLSPVLVGEAGQDWTSIGNKADFAAGAFGTGGARLLNLSLSGLSPAHSLKGGDLVKIRARYQWDQKVVKDLIQTDFYAADMSVGIALADVRGSYVFGCNTIDSEMRVDPFSATEAEVEFRFVMPHLKPENYFLTVTLALGTQEHHVQMNWYDGIAQIRCESGKKNTYGAIALDYVTERLGVSAESANSFQNRVL